jgi:hypothetical protein
MNLAYWYLNKANKWSVPFSDKAIEIVCRGPIPKVWTGCSNKTSSVFSPESIQRCMEMLKEQDENRKISEHFPLLPGEYAILKELLKLK